MKLESPLENKILRTLDEVARLMMPISGDALAIMEAREQVEKGKNKIATYAKYSAGIAFKYVSLRILAEGIYNVVDMIK